MKKVKLFETINEKLNVSEDNGVISLSGIFGIAGIKNRNGRIYNKENYGQMVEALQSEIESCGLLGQLEHPYSLNIDLNNVSHKIDNIEMDENGVVRGTITLLNTPKGQIAKAVVESGLPLFISSRGAGTIDEKGNVTLSTISTYDIVSRSGFAEAKLTVEELDESKLYMLEESDDQYDTKDNALEPTKVEVAETETKETEVTETEVTETEATETEKADVEEQIPEKVDLSSIKDEISKW